MIKHYLIPIAFLVFISTPIFGQNKSFDVRQPELDSGTIDNQFDYILTQSNRWKEFQLIRRTSLLKVKSHTLDSLIILHQNLVSIHKLTSKLNVKIVTLEKEIASLKKEIAVVSEEIDSINFFGKNMSKITYNLMMWSIVILLLLMLITILIRYKSLKQSTKTTKYELEKSESEFEVFRKNALKKEQEIMRKLQDEINKNSF